MNSLLATKLRSSPIPSKRVQRPRLSQKLSEGYVSGCQLTLVSAPAGFGKSTCVSEWLSSLDEPVTWLSLEPADDDAGRFFSYFMAALQKVDASIGREFEALLRTGQLPPLETLITPLLNDILNTQRKFILVLDDFQVIRESAILKVLGMLIANQPKNMHLVLVTREDPQLPLARLRAHNQMTEIRAGDLRFSSREADQLMNEMMGLRLSQADIAVLEERTEGWIAGLQLAGLSIRDRADPSAFIASLSGSHRHILSYLTEEVLNRQPGEIQHFLLQTSILDKLSGDLCNAVTRRADSADLLEKLFTNNLFLIPLDDEGTWFRYHHLFADLLQARLRQLSPVGAVVVLHERAAAWFEQNAYASEAVSHALAAGDFEGIARLIEQNADLMLTRGELTTLIRWIEALPDDVIRLHPFILIAKAWSLTLAGAIRQVEPLLQQAEAQITPGDETPATRNLSGNINAIRAFFSMLVGEYPRALELAQRAEELLPESSVQARSLLPYTLGSAYRGEGQYEKAVEAFIRVAGMGEKHQNLVVWATGMTEVVNVRRVQGRLRDAAEVGCQALQRMKEQGAYPFGSLAKLEVALIEVLREQNALDEAYRRVTGVIARMQAWVMPTDRIFAYLALIHIQESQGDLAGAWDNLRIAKDLKTTYPILMNLARAVDFHEIRLYLASGDVSNAARLVDGLHLDQSRIASLREQTLTLFARVRLAQGVPGEAVAILDPLVHDEGGMQRLSIWLESLVLQALALDAQGDRGASVALILKALALGEPEGFVRVFVDEGRMMQNLLSVARQQILADHLASDPLRTYIEKLLDIFHDRPLPAGDSLSQERNAALVEPLTERELDVLRLIVEGLKYDEIAARLFISLNTVRTYVKAIYSKLNVNNRSKAIALAHQQKLI